MCGVDAAVLFPAYAQCVAHTSSQVLLDLTRYKYAPLRALAFGLIDRYMMEKTSLLRRMLATQIIVDPTVLHLYKQVGVWEGLKGLQSTVLHLYKQVGVWEGLRGLQFTVLHLHK